MSPRLRWILALAALIGLTLASYAPVLDAGFVRFDDTGYLQGNPNVSSGLSAENLRWALTGYHLSNWHPLTWISHMADIEWFGFEPRGHHAVNLALHVLNVLLLFAVLHALTRDAAPSLLVAGLFALHPANVEVVAWIAQRKSLLSTAFALLSIWAYARWVRGGGRRAYAGSLAALALSLLSKPMLVTFPFVLLLLDYWPLRRAEFEPAVGRSVSLRQLIHGLWKLLPEKLPFLLLCAVTVVITLDAQQDAMSPIDHYPLSDRLGNVARSYAEYLGTFFAPFELAVFYPLDPEGLTASLLVGSLALLVAITAGVVWLGLRRRYLLVGWLWFLGTLVPVIGLVQVGMQSMADRYVYLPFWGLAIAVAWSAQDLLRMPAVKPWLRGAVAMGAVLLLCGLAFLTHRRTFDWHDGIRLFESALANTERNWLAHGLLAERYYAQSDFETSIAHSIEAAKYNRDMGTVRSTWGLALYGLGKTDAALEQFELAAAEEPTNPIGFMNLGWLHTERGHYDLALASLSSAADKITRKTPPYTKKTIYANWANALAKSQQLPEARERYASALEVDPDSIDLLRDAARVDLQLGDPARAADRLRHALAIEPTDPDALYLLASATLLQGEAGPGAAELQRALARDPRKAVVTIDLARSLARAGKRNDAVRLLHALLALQPAENPDDARFVTSTTETHLGELALEAGDVAGAIAALDRAVAIWPDNYDANTRLAFLLSTNADPKLRNPARAVELAERASRERREYGSLATLAVAYSAAGRKTDAIDTTRDALELASQANDAQAVASLQNQLRLFSQAAQ